MKNNELQVNYSNDYFAMTTYFVKTVLRQVEDRKNSLTTDLLLGKFEKFIKHAGKFAGRQPSLHIETGLLDRVRQAGFNNLVQDIKSPKQNEFEDALSKAENLMSAEVNTDVDLKRLVQATARVSKACKFPKEKFRRRSIDVAANYQINKQSSSGFPLYLRKGRVLEELVEQANRVLKGWRAPFDWPITRGFRLQLRPSVNKVDLKVRVMYPYPGCIILLEDIFIMPFVQHFINTDTFYVIGRNGKKISDLIKKKFNNRDIKRLTSTDISSFDQNVLNIFSIAAFSILRNQLHLTKEENSVFVEITKYFCTSLAVSKQKGKPSYGFIKVKGVPSGSGFTNMIDTLVHAICLEYVLPGILSHDRTLLCGDDNLFDSTNVNLNELTEGMMKYCNLPISPEKSENFNNWQKVKFLGFTWYQGIRFQDRKLLLNQMLYHAQFRTDLDKYERELARGASVLLNAKNGAEMFRKIFPDVVALLESGVDVRFYYLYGTQPPSTLPSVYGYIKQKGLEKTLPSINASLTEHLHGGWLIR